MLRNAGPCLNREAREALTTAGDETRTAVTNAKSHVDQATLPQLTREARSTDNAPRTGRTRRP